MPYYFIRMKKITVSKFAIENYTVHSPAEKLWLKCSVVGDITPCDKESGRCV
jgi:hypothetical protein